MKNSIILKFGLFVSASWIVFFAANCKTHLTSFTLIATKPIDLSQIKVQKTAASQGENMAAYILFIPAGSATVQSAVEDAVAKVPGGIAMVNGVVYSYVMPLLIFTRYGYIVEGSVLIDPKLAADASAPKKSSFIVSMDAQDEGKSRLYYLAKDDYARVQEELRSNHVAEAKSIVQAKSLK